MFIRAISSVSFICGQSDIHHCSPLNVLTFVRFCLCFQIVSWCWTNMSEPSRSIRFSIIVDTHISDLKFVYIRSPYFLLSLKLIWNFEAQSDDQRTQFGCSFLVYSRLFVYFNRARDFDVTSMLWRWLSCALIVEINFLIAFWLLIYLRLIEFWWFAKKHLESFIYWMSFLKSWYRNRISGSPVIKSEDNWTGFDIFLKTKKENVHTNALNGY